MISDVKKNRKRLWRLIVKNRYMYLMLLPVIAYFIIFKYWPMYYLRMAFYDFKIMLGFEKSKYLGFQNFVQFMTGSNFTRVISNTMILNILSLFLMFPLCILLAIMLNEVRSRWFKNTIQTLTYMPHFISTVILISMINNVISPSVGILGSLAKLMGGKPYYYLGDPAYFRAINVISGIWQTTGWNSIVFLAAIMAMMYSEGLLDLEFASRTLTDSYAVMNSGIGGSMQAFAEQSLTTTTALRETDPDAKCECIEPVQGPLGDKLIPARSTVSQKGCITTAGADKVEKICKFFDYLWSAEGMTLMNYGVEGVTFEYDAEGNPKIISPYVDSFANARGVGLNFQMLPTCWTVDSYVQILTQGKTYEELPEANKFFYDGLFMNDPYFVKLAPQLATEAYSDYNADIIPAIKELQANAIAGRISVDDFFTGYEALKPQGLRAIIDANAEASAKLQ